MTAPLVEVRDAGVRLKAFIRDHVTGECRILSTGEDCQCPLCDVDRLYGAALTATPAERATRETLAVLREEAEKLVESWATSAEVTSLHPVMRAYERCISDLSGMRLFLHDHDSRLRTALSRTTQAAGTPDAEGGMDDK